MRKLFIGALVVVCAVAAYAAHVDKPVNIDRVVTGSNNYGTDPNSTKDISLANDEYIDNSTDGRVDISGNTYIVGDTIFFGGGAAKMFVAGNDSSISISVVDTTLILLTR